MRLIDADALTKNWERDKGRMFDADYFIFTIEHAPTIDVVPVQVWHGSHGRWKNYKDEHTCSVCDYSFCDEWYSDDDVYNYCPNCGARMAEGDEQ